MIIYPAIDLISAKAVRLERGDYDKKTEYSDNPVEIAKIFASDGAEYVHIVDLDGAKARRPINTEVIKDISEALDIPIQVGGGIRSLEACAQLLQYADRAIIGTVAVSEPETLRRLIGNFGQAKIVVSVDYKDGRPAINGWTQTGELSTETLSAHLQDAGVKTLIVTDTDKDGLLRGPNIGLMKIWKSAGFEVICAGGVTTAGDIRLLAEAGIDGAIIGKALYENRITLKEALDAS